MTCRLLWAYRPYSGFWMAEAAEAEVGLAIQVLKVPLRVEVAEELNRTFRTSYAVMVGEVEVAEVLLLEKSLGRRCGLLVLLDLVLEQCCHWFVVRGVAEVSEMSLAEALAGLGEV